MEKYYVSGCRDDGENIQTCVDGEADFFTLYERDEEGLSQGVIDFRFKEDAIAAMSVYVERESLQQRLEAAENLANFRGEMVKDCLRKSMPKNIAAIIDSGDLEAICYGHEYPGAENHRMALFNFRMTRRSEAKETADSGEGK